MNSQLLTSHQRRTYVVLVVKNKVSPTDAFGMMPFQLSKVEMTMEKILSIKAL